jgi:transcriptional regulator with XRE-family HTH domain
VLRAERGLTQAEAARRMGITGETLSDLERGKRRAYSSTLVKISEAYGVPVAELVEEPTGGPSRSSPALQEDPLYDPSFPNRVSEAEALVDVPPEEVAVRLQWLRDEQLIDLQRQCMELLRYRYGPKVFATWEEVQAYMDSEEQRRGDRVSEVLGEVRKVVEARADALSRARAQALSPA